MLRHQIDPFIGTLGRENRRDQKLQRRIKAKRTRRIGIIGRECPYDATGEAFVFRVTAREIFCAGDHGSSMPLVACAVWINRPGKIGIMRRHLRDVSMSGGETKKVPQRRCARAASFWLSMQPIVKDFCIEFHHFIPDDHSSLRVDRIIDWPLHTAVFIIGPERVFYKGQA